MALNKPWGKTMKITLVECGTSRQELNEPIGLEILSGVLQDTFDNSVIVKIISLQITNLGECIDDLLTSDIVGISVQMGSFSKFKKMMKLLKDVGGDKPLVVVGNIVPTFASDLLLIDYPEIICVLGEGENAIIDIANCVFTHDPLLNFDEVKQCLVSKNTPNLAVNIDGKVSHTDRKVVDLEKLPHPSRSLLQEIVNRKGIVRIESSRGCPWNKCSFCSIVPRYGSGEWRPYPIDYVLDELEKLSSYGVNRPYFTDEDFIGNDFMRIFQLAEEIIIAKNEGKISRKLSFFISTSVLTISKLGSDTKIIELFILLKQAGLREVFLGIESGSKSQLLRYNKGVRSDLNGKILDIINNLGILIDPGFIMFDPEMSLIDLSDNLSFIHNFGLDNIDGRLTKPLLVLPQTGIAERLLKKGVIDCLVNIEDLYSTYKFLVPEVQIIYDTFSQWEKEASEPIYAIQSRMRGEVTSEEQRGKDRDSLRALRKLDLRFLERGISLIRVNKRMNSKRLREQLEGDLHFSENRESIICLAKIEKGNQHF